MKIYIVYYSTTSEPSYEIIDCFMKEEDAIKRMEALRERDDIYMSYYLPQLVF